MDTWLKSAMNQVMEELENERWASLPTLTTHDLSLSVRLKRLHADPLTFHSNDANEVGFCSDAFDKSPANLPDPLLPVSVRPA